MIPDPGGRWNGPLYQASRLWPRFLAVFLVIQGIGGAVLKVVSGRAGDIAHNGLHLVLGAVWPCSTAATPPGHAVSRLASAVSISPWRSSGGGGRAGCPSSRWVSPTTYSISSWEPCRGWSASPPGKKTDLPWPSRRADEVRPVKEAIGSMGVVSVVGLVILVIPDTGPRLFSISREHGPSTLDLVGIAILIGGWLILVDGCGRPAPRSWPARPAICWDWVGWAVSAPGWWSPRSLPTTRHGGWWARLCWPPSRSVPSQPPAGPNRPEPTLAGQVTVIGSPCRYVDRRPSVAYRRFN